MPQLHVNCPISIRAARKISTVRKELAGHLSFEPRRKSVWKVCAKLDWFRFICRISRWKPANDNCAKRANRDAVLWVCEWRGRPRRQRHGPTSRSLSLRYVLRRPHKWSVEQTANSLPRESMKQVQICTSIVHHYPIFVCAKFIQTIYSNSLFKYGSQIMSRYFRFTTAQGD